MRIFRNTTNRSIILPALGGIGILTTVFSTEPFLRYGLATEEIFWFHKTSIIFSITVFLSSLSTFYSCKTTIYKLRTNSIHISFPDLFLLVFFAITLLTYNWNLNPEPEKILFGGQLIILWFLLKIILKEFPSLKLFFLVFIIITGFIQAVWGVLQLYGYTNSYHPHFQITGSFLNPGPFSGYLAIICPVALDLILRITKFKKSRRQHFTTVLYFIAWISFIMILLVLPAGLSRAAWISAGISCSWVCYQYFSSGIQHFMKQIWGTKKTKYVLSVLLICFAVSAINSLYLLKRDSAYGRLLMWKVTTRAFIHKPVTGAGVGGFPSVFAKEQANYLASTHATANEKRVAGSVKYAFNEYLQISLETGILGLICFLTWLFFSFNNGRKNRHTGMAGGILSFAVFACFSYPLHLPSFWILLIFMSSISVNESYLNRYREEKTIFKINTLFILCVTISFSIILFSKQRTYYKAYHEWSHTSNYEKIYPVLKHKPEYLFEHAQFLNERGHYQDAIQLLKRASQLSADPMIWYIMGKNAQASGSYEEAENYILYGINILPERIYPYYLLSKLYAEPDFYNPDKLQAAIDSVLHKRPKVQTTAILEMQEEILKLLQSK